MDLEESYAKLTQRKAAAGFDQTAPQQQVSKDVMRLICVGLDVDIDDLHDFAVDYVKGMAQVHALAVSYSGMVVASPDLVVGLMIDMVVLGAYHQEQARREVSSGDE